MTEAKSPLTLSHDEAVAELNQVIGCIHAARERCHDDLRATLAGQVADDTVEHTLMVVDGYAASLEAHFNTLLELKLLHPAAWDASEGGRSARAHEAALAELVTESLAMVFGLRWPGQPDDRSASERTSGRTAVPPRG
jgi:hypothetical protein